MPKSSDEEEGGDELSAADEEQQQLQGTAQAAGTEKSAAYVNEAEDQNMRDFLKQVVDRYASTSEAQRLALIDQVESHTIKMSSNGKDQGTVPRATEDTKSSNNSALQSDSDPKEPQAKKPAALAAPASRQRGDDDEEEEEEEDRKLPARKVPPHPPRHQQQQQQQAMLSSKFTGAPSKRKSKASLSASKATGGDTKMTKAERQLQKRRERERINGRKKRAKKIIAIDCLNEQYHKLSYENNRLKSQNEEIRQKISQVRSLTQQQQQQQQQEVQRKQQPPQQLEAPTSNLGTQTPETLLSSLSTLSGGSVPNLSGEKLSDTLQQLISGAAPRQQQAQGQPGPLQALQQMFASGGLELGMPQQQQHQSQQAHSNLFARQVPQAGLSSLLQQFAPQQQRGQGSNNTNAAVGLPPLVSLTAQLQGSSVHPNQNSYGAPPQPAVTDALALAIMGATRPQQQQGREQGSFQFQPPPQQQQSPPAQSAQLQQLLRQMSNTAPAPTTNPLAANLSGAAMNQGQQQQQQQVPDIAALLVQLLKQGGGGGGGNQGNNHGGSGGTSGNGGSLS